jgi:hypothetical protein
MKFLHRPAWRIFLIVLITGLTWAVVTGQEWEDFYITYRASKNLAEGRGLTFTEGERVHSFTSPLGVLLPAASYLLTGRSSDVGALWIFRIMCLAAWGGAAVLMWRTLRQLYPATAAPAALLVTLLAVDSKTICFVTSGMETAFVLLFLAWSLRSLWLRPPRLALHLGLSWAGLMWSRPDSCIYIAALAAGFLLFAPGAGGYMKSRWPLLRSIAVAGAVCAIVYLPWFTWAWSYYGTPVPHTITAKGLFNEMSVGGLAKSLVGFPHAIIAGKSSLPYTFAPYHGGHPPWAPLAIPISFALALIPLVLLVLPFVRWEARLAAFVYLVGQFYLTAIVGYPVPWYIPHVTFLCLAALVLGFGQWLTLAAGWQNDPTRNKINAGRWLTRAGWITALAVVLGTAALSVAMARQACLEMTIIEHGIRAPIGKWLHAEAKSRHETVFLEPLGFIGYHSGLKMLDYPGLGSPEVVAARRLAPDHAYPSCLAELILSLRPDWIVLRPFELAELNRYDPLALTELYEKARVFDATSRIQQATWVTIRSYLEFNGVFEVYRLKAGRRAQPHPLIPLLRPVTLEQMSTRESPLPVEFAGRNLKAHAPSRLVTAVPPRASQLLGGFGIFEGAYAKPRPEATDGAEFIIEHVADDGKRTVLLQRFLNPAVVASDRGLQHFNAALPSMGGQIVFTINAGPYQSNAYDWSYWYDARFGLPSS